MPDTSKKNQNKAIMMERKLFLPLLLPIERYGEIERENRILLEKMSNIMGKTGSQLYNPGKLNFNFNSCRHIRKRLS